MSVVFDSDLNPTRYTLTFYVPPSSLAACKAALFAAGAGTYPGGLYSHACFEVKGTGQFRPESGAKPHVGAVGEIKSHEEVKVEMICVGRDLMLHAVKALKRVHPYEVVAYSVVRMEDV